MSQTLQPAQYCSTTRSAHSQYAFQNFAALKDSIALSFISLGKALEIHPGPLDGYYLVQIPTRGHAEITYGDSRLRIDSEHWSLLSPVQPVTINWSADCELLEIKIRQSALEEELAKLSGIKAQQPIEFGPEFQDVGGRADSLYQLLVYLCGQLEQAASTLDFSRTGARLEELILTMILESQEHNYSRALLAPDAEAGHMPPRFINCAMQFMSSHADDHLQLKDIASASGASVRSLNAGFRKYQGTTPMQYLKNTRLDYVRAALLAADYQYATVTDIAYRWGFRHLGRFSAEYKRRFGEHPSDTLSVTRIRNTLR